MNILITILASIVGFAWGYELAHTKAYFRGAKDVVDKITELLDQKEKEQKNE